MKKWMRRGAAWALVLAALLSPPGARAVLSDVYFTAVNDQLLELSDETMPFFSGGVLYVSSRLFEGTDLGVNYVRDTNSGLAMLYTANTKVDLRFDLEEQVAYDRQGNFYSGRAIERGGVIFFPLDLVCKRFGLNHTYTLTDTVPLIRVTSASAILDDAFFIDAASTQMADRYAEYERAAVPPEEGGTTASPDKRPVPPVHQPPSTPEDPVQAAEGQKVYLILSCQAADALSAMERLEGVQATFLLTAEEMENADLLRGLVAQGHAVALRLTGQTEEEAAGELERARELLWQAACSWLELVWYEGGADLGALLEAEGCARVSGTLDQRSRGLTGSGQAGTLLRTIGRYREDVSVYLGGGRLGGLTPLLEGLEEGGYRVCAWRLTASQHLFST